jgi:cell division protease FtsH
MIFIDEIDGIGANRGAMSNSDKDQTLNQLLVCLDGFKDNSGIFLIGSTNQLQSLDAALIRDGRIDKKILVDYPDNDARNEIIKIHIKLKPYDESISMKKLVDITSGFSSAQIETLLNEAMLHALRHKREIMTFDDIGVIYNRVISGWKNTESKYSDLIFNKIIIHELGHAFVGLFTPYYNKLEKITLNPFSTEALGFAKFEQSDVDKFIRSKDFFMADLAVSLGGRISEEIFYGHNDITSGAKSDYERAKQIAESMILSHHMGKIKIYSSLSEKSKEIIDAEINELLAERTNYTYNLLMKLKNIIDITRSYLINKKNNNNKIELDYDEILNIISTHQPELLNLL